MTHLLKILLSLLPPRVVKFTYLILLKPKPLRWLINGVISHLIPHHLNLPEGTVILNQGDVGVSGALAFGAHDPFEIDTFREALQPNMTVIDIGANLGYYTVIAAGRVGPGGHVLAYEPAEKNFTLLCNNIHINQFSWVQAFKIALSDTAGTRSLFLDPTHTGTHSFVNNRGTAKPVEVVTETLDNHLDPQKYPRVDIIKIDVEGAEILVFQGMKEVIERSPGLILFCEFYPQAIMRLGKVPLDFLNELNSLGFSLSILDEDTRKVIPFPVRDFGSFLTAYPKKGELVTNLYGKRFL